MNKNEGMPREMRTKFFRSMRKEGEIDDFTFHVWKSELQKELPSFWEEMKGVKER